MENKNKVATVRKGGVSQNETESLSPRLMILTGKDSFFKIPVSESTSIMSGTFSSEEEMRSLVNQSYDYDHDHDDVVTIINFKASVVHHVLYPKGWCDDRQEH